MYHARNRLHSLGKHGRLCFWWLACYEHQAPQREGDKQARIAPLRYTARCCIADSVGLQHPRILAGMSYAKEYSALKIPARPSVIATQKQGARATLAHDSCVIIVTAGA